MCQKNVQDDGQTESERVLAIARTNVVRRALQMPYTVRKTIIKAT